jgi:hypothetical protein
LEESGGFKRYGSTEINVYNSPPYLGGSVEPFAKSSERGKLAVFTPPAAAPAPAVRQPHRVVKSPHCSGTS